jgi:hypothetical protein
MPALVALSDKVSAVLTAQQGTNELISTLVPKKVTPELVDKYLFLMEQTVMDAIYNWGKVRNIFCFSLASRRWSALRSLFRPSSLILSFPRSDLVFQCFFFRYRECSTSKTEASGPSRRPSLCKVRLLMPHQMNPFMLVVLTFSLCF